MDNDSDRRLIAQFLEGDRDEAFRSLVERHSRMVYGCARRLVGDHATAQDVSQAVFALLCRKADTMKKHGSVAGWLYQTTTWVSRATLKMDRRREARHRQGEPAEPADCHWEDLAGCLDAGMGELPEADRHALLLRYFENRPLREVGDALGLSDDAAQKRVSRALERLRTILGRKGVRVSGTGLATLVSANASPALPPSVQDLLISSASSTIARHGRVEALVDAASKSLSPAPLKMIILSALLVLGTAGGVGIYVVLRTPPESAAAARQAGSPLQRLEELAQAARVNDGTAILNALNLVSPDHARRAKALTDTLLAVGRLDRASRRAFGDSDTESVLWKADPPVLFKLEFGQENLASASEDITGDTALVNISRGGGVIQYIRFQKVAGLWKIHEEAVDDLVSDADATRYAKLRTLFDAVATEIEAGSISSAKEARDRIATRVRSIESGE